MTERVAALKTAVAIAGIVRILKRLLIVMVREPYPV